MPKLWSEAPGARAREISADAATLIWVGFWAVLCSRLYAFLAGLAKAGRAIREGGVGLNATGEQIGEALGRTPVIGHRVGEMIRSAFSAVSERFVEIGGCLRTKNLIIVAPPPPGLLAYVLYALLPPDPPLPIGRLLARWGGRPYNLPLSPT